MVRETWQSRVGFILAAVGSAVGLGNLWRFPWMAAENGGSAFLVVYLVLVLFVGVPGLLGAFVLGRRSERNPVGALHSLSGSRRWRGVGLLFLVTSVAILSFYTVVGGWILRYTVESATGAYFAAPDAYFGRIDFGFEAVGFQLLFLGITAAIVAGGIRDGIERATTVMMPLILLLLVALAGWAITLPGAGDGLEFYLAFDATTLQEGGLGLLRAAAGQALFTLSVGAGTMITYASYLDEGRSLPADGASIAVLNTIVGVLAGLVVFPLLFSMGVEPGSGGPGALFVSLAGAFAELPYGSVLATIFFLVVALAALSSSISILELPVSYLVDEHGLERRQATLGVSVVLATTGTAAALVPSLFNTLAGVVVDQLLTLGLLVILLFAGWVVGRDALEEYQRGTGPVGRALGTPWLYGIAIVLPAFLLFTLVSGWASIGNLSIAPTFQGGLALALALVSYAGLRGPNSIL
ncbi:MAG TPA: sodium-dependent transporter [Natrialbaceae archaeon]|nr:sodium-dependent transporter [Natrialbaceae archaeon]